MKTALYTVLALALAAPVAASTFDLGDAPLTPAQNALVQSILSSDDNTNTKQRRIDVAVGTTKTFSSAATVEAASAFLLQSSDDNESTRQRNIDVVVGNTATFGSQAAADAAAVKFLLSSDKSTNDIERSIKAIVN